MITPSLDDIYKRLVSDISGKLGQTWNENNIGTLRIILYPIAGLFYQIYKLCSWLYFQIFPSLASEEALDNWGDTVGITRNRGTYAQLNVTITGTEGTDIPLNTKFTGSKNQIVYSSIVEGVIAGGTASIAIEAAQIGIIGNLSVSDELSFVKPQPLLDDAVTVSAVVAPALDIEDIEIFRGRILKELRQPPQGGALADYINWGLEVQGVAHVYPTSSLTEGKIDVYIESTDESVYGIPTQTLLDEVAANINSAYHRPLTALVDTKPITRTAFHLTITGLSSPDMAVLKTRILSEFTLFFYARAPFRAGYDTENSSRFNQFSIEALLALLLNATNSDVTSIALSLEATPTNFITEYTLGSGEKARLGGITYA